MIGVAAGLTLQRVVGAARERVLLLLIGVIVLVLLMVDWRRMSPLPSAR